MPQRAFCLRPQAADSHSKQSASLQTVLQTDVRDEEILDVDPGLPAQPLSKRLMPKLKDSKQLLFYEKSPQANMGFISSNEYDIYERTMDTRKSEIFIGAGSNSVWDLATRRNTDIMVIWDVNEEIIIAQEYLYKPLILIADSPAEFLSFLSGIPLPEDIKDSPIGEVFKHINMASRQILNELPEQIERSNRFIAEIEKSIREHPGLGVQHALFVKRHLIYIRESKRFIENTFFRSKIEAENTFSYNVTSGARNNLYRDFERMYNPNLLVKLGARKAQVMASNFSSFSSLESFKKLKRLFEGERVYYVIGNIFNRWGYKAVAALSEKTGLKVSGFSISNIIDCTTKKDREKAELKDKIMSIIRSYLDIDYTFTIYETHGTRLPHTYVTFGINDQPIPKSPFAGNILSQEPIYSLIDSAA